MVSFRFINRHLLFKRVWTFFRMSSELESLVWVSNSNELFFLSGVAKNIDIMIRNFLIGPFSPCIGLVAYHIQVFCLFYFRLIIRFKL